MLRLPLTRAAMQRLLRFWTWCRGLSRDFGSQHGVARQDKICPLCRDGVGDELHLVIECRALQDLQIAFAPIFEGVATMQPDAAVHVAAKSAAAFTLLRC